MRSAVLLFIMVAQLLIPLLHGHFGTPNQAGLHVHAMPSRGADSHFLCAARDSLSEQQKDSLQAEPFEVDVQAALQPLDTFPMPLLAVVGLALLTMGLRAARMRCVAPRLMPRLYPPPRIPRWRGRVIKPSPSRAPPLCS